jgi:putative transposase
MEWARLLGYITGTVDQELLLRNEYLLAENRVLRKQIQGRLRLTDSERESLAEIGARLGRKALAQVTTLVKPETILAWHGLTGHEKALSESTGTAADRTPFRGAT